MLKRYAIICFFSLQLSDCQRGIVFDGLETLFSPNMAATCTSILRALNNRKYIFFVTLTLDQARLRAVNEKRREEQGLICIFVLQHLHS